MFPGYSSSCCSLSTRASLATPLNLILLNNTAILKKTENYVLDSKYLNVVLIKDGLKHMPRSFLNNGIRGFFSPQDFLCSLSENLQGCDCSRCDASVSFWDKKD